jgi:CHAT domain-containing protein
VVELCQRLVLAAVLLSPSLALAASAPEELLINGDAAYERGSFNEAIREWQQEGQLYEDEENVKGQTTVLLKLAAAYQTIGQQRLAVETWEHAEQLAEQSHDRKALVIAKSGLGTAYTCGHEKDLAEQLLRESLDLARAARDAKLTAPVLNNLSSFLADQGKTSEAIDMFRECATLAQQSTNQTLAAKALANAAATAARGGPATEARQLNEEALIQVRELAPSHEQAMLYIRCGQTDWQLSERQPNAKGSSLAGVAKSYLDGLSVSTKLGDKRAQTYALGYLGQVREATGQTAEALDATRRAAFIAQELALPDALYRWQWQIGRLLKVQGDRDGAIAAYRRSLQTLQQIRNDLAFSYGGTRAPFRESVGPVYYELADLLLRRTDGMTNAPAAQQTLLEARDTVEQMKSAELEDYFRDECVDPWRARTARIEQIANDTAVVYIIPLPDRTELLVSFASGMQRFKLPVTAAVLTEEVHQFRLNLEKRTTNQYLTQARRLYQWIVAPIKDTLALNHVQTLVFVPDGALRTIPMAALQDGDRFLIEQYAVAVTPGLTLLAPRPIARTHVTALVAGLSEAVENYPPLPYVAEELSGVQAQFGGHKLLDRDFLVSAVTRDFEKTQFQLVHFATHGYFDREASRSFIVTHDGKLSLDQLEALLRPAQFRGRPVELLTLSACQTAAGDDRAALGLAGVAVKAGARSVLATLWFVHDQSTAILMSEFYAQLRQGPTTSKASALQRAQVKVLRDPRYEHPCYWAPYLIIGNWL